MILLRSIAQNYGRIMLPKPIYIDFLGENKINMQRNGGEGA